MTIEPSSVRFSIGSKVIPPRPFKPTPQPALSMAEEARLVRARALRTWGPLNQYVSGEEANVLRKQLADARREQLAEQAMELIAERAMTSAEMIDILNSTENKMRKALALLKDAGRVEVFRGGGKTVWRVRRAAE